MIDFSKYGKEHGQYKELKELENKRKPNNELSDLALFFRLGMVIIGLVFIIFYVATCKRTSLLPLISNRIEQSSDELPPLPSTDEAIPSL